MGEVIGLIFVTCRGTEGEGRRRRGRQRMGWLDGITDSMDMNLGKWGDGEGQGSLACCSPMGREESDTTWQLNSNKRGSEGSYRGRSSA